MVQSKKIIILIILVMLLCVQTVSAVPPVQSTIVAPEGLEIESTNFGYLQQDTHHNFRFRVYNSSNNVFLNDDAVNCSMGIFDNKGESVFQQAVVTASGYVFSVNVTAENFTRLGIYHQGINCISNDGTAGGVKTLSFEVTYTGTELTTATSILNLGFLVLLIFIFLLTVIAVGLIEDNEVKDDYGQLLSLDNLKYFKGVLVAFAYATLIAVFFTASNIAIAYLSGIMFGDLLFVIYKILVWLSIPFVIVWLIWLFVNIFRDKEMQSLINRGMGGEQV